MNLSKSTRYALYAAAEMARAGDAPTTVGAVSARYRIPEGALAKVFQQMVRAGLATGTRGIGGGYRLSRSPSKISVRDVVRVFERPREPDPEPADRSVQWLLEEVDDLVQSTFESVTLRTLIGQRRSGN